MQIKSLGKGDYLMYRRLKPGPLEKDNYVIYQVIREIKNAMTKHPEKIIPIVKDYNAYKLSFNDRYIVLDKEGIIVLTARGYGYKTIESATNALQASIGGPLGKRNTHSSLQKKITHLNEIEPKVFKQLTDQYRAYYVESMDRYVLVNEFGTICADGNGYGFRTIATARKAANYLEDHQKRCRQNWKRNRRQSSRPQSYDIDMEMADCYYGYNASDFC